MHDSEVYHGWWRGRLIKDSIYGSWNTQIKVVFGGRQESGCARDTTTVRDGGALPVQVDTLPSRGEGSGNARRRGYVRNRARAEKASLFEYFCVFDFTQKWKWCKIVFPGARLDSGRGYRALIHISKIWTRRGAPQRALLARYPPSKF